MLRQHISKLCSSASGVLALATPLVGALVRYRELWFDSKLRPTLQKTPLNVVLAVIVVALGLLAILITPILPILAVGVIAFFISYDRRAAIIFVMTGGLTTAMGALATVALPLSPIASIRLEGSPLTATLLPTPGPYMIFGIAAIGILSLGLGIELTPIQRDILSTLINLHRQEKQTVKGEEIAELMDRHPGTIRNQMQSLKSLNLVEGVTGPKGGYTAMSIAYDVLSLDNSNGRDNIAVPVIRNGIVVEGVSATEIVLDKLMQPTYKCDGLVRIIGNVRDFRIGDEVVVGPTPVHQIRISGKVLGRDCTTNRLMLNITGILSIPRLTVKKIAQPAVRIGPKATLREASRILVNNGVQEALVEGISPGLINLADITWAVAEGRTDLEVREIMTHSFLIINSDELIIDAIKILGKTGVSQLVVSDNGMLWGFVTPRNLIKSLLPYRSC